MGTVEVRTLGRTGLRVSALGFGCGSVAGLMVGDDAQEQARTVERAFRAGVTYFDTAPGYGQGRSEENLGRALQALGLGDRVVIGTKVRFDTEAELADPAATARKSLEASLKRLRRESVEMVLLHNPLIVPTVTDRAPPGLPPLSIEAAPRALEGLLKAQCDGLVNHVGFSGLGDTEALHQAVAMGAFEVTQCPFSVLNPSAAMAGLAGGSQDYAGFIELAANAGIGVQTIRAFAAGALGAGLAGVSDAGSGSRRRGEDYAIDRVRSAERDLASLAADFEIADGPAELGLRFALSQSGIATVIAGMTDADRLETAVRWAERGPLPPDAIRRVLQTAA